MRPNIEIPWPRAEFDPETASRYRAAQIAHTTNSIERRDMREDADWAWRWGRWAILGIVVLAVVLGFGWPDAGVKP